MWCICYFVGLHLIQDFLLTQVPYLHSYTFTTILTQICIDFIVFRFETNYTFVTLPHKNGQGGKILSMFISPALFSGCLLAFGFT